MPKPGNPVRLFLWGLFVISARRSRLVQAHCPVCDSRWATIAHPARCTHIRVTCPHCRTYEIECEVVRLFLDYRIHRDRQALGRITRLADALATRQRMPPCVTAQNWRSLATDLPCAA